MQCRSQSSINFSAALLATVLAMNVAGGVHAQEELLSGFSFQASGVKESGDKLNGRFDVRLRLFDAAEDGEQVGAEVVLENVKFKKGKATLNDLDFGPGALNGEERFLQIEVQPTDGDEGFRAVERRIPIKAVPYALALPGLYTQPGLEAPSVVGGSPDNFVQDDVDGAVIAGGGFGGVTFRNEVFSGGDFAVIGGGFQNQATGNTAVIAGGQRNIASGRTATIGGGSSNIASGLFATVPGGAGNVATATDTFAAGRNATAAHQGTYVWQGPNNNGRFESTGPNQYLVMAPGGVGINTNQPFAAVHVDGRTAPTGLLIETRDQQQSSIAFLNDDATNAGLFLLSNAGKIRASNQTAAFAELQDNGVWTASSDARLKKDVRPLGDDTLDRLMQIEPVSYAWKDEAITGRSIGFLAQDVMEEFPQVVYGDEQSYYRLDYNGLAVIAIDAVQEMKAKYDEAIQERDERIADLESRMNALEAMVARSQEVQ